MTYGEWEAAIPEAFRRDPLWTVTAYRKALFLSDLAWSDVTKLMGDLRTREIAAQLYDAVGSIHANLSEGYSRSGRRDRAKFYDYALGSARESRGWYYNGRHVVGDDVVQHRVELITEIIKLLMVMIPNVRSTE